MGSLDSGEAVDLPAIGVSVLRRLAAGATFDQAGGFAERRHGEAPDVEDFVGDLIGLGFVTHVDGVPAGPVFGVGEAAGSTLPWLKPRHVQWLFRPTAVICVLLFAVAGPAVALARHRLHLTYEVFFATGYPGVTLAWSLFVFAVSAVLHECAHLAAARSAGIPARISLSTRLIYLTPQTSAPLLWLVDLRLRLRFYAAGMVTDLVLASGTALTAAFVAPQGIAGRLAASATLAIGVGVVLQFAFCLRTDVYLMVQSLLGCRNLYADARAYARYLYRRARGGGAEAGDPTEQLPVRERRRVRVYAFFMAVGVAVLLATSAFYGLPTAWGLYVQALRGVESGRPGRVVDAVVAVVLGAGADLLPFLLIVKRLVRRRVRPRRQ